MPIIAQSNATPIGDPQGSEPKTCVPNFATI